VGRSLWDSGISQWVEAYGIVGIAQWAEHYGIVGELSG